MDKFDPVIAKHYDDAILIVVSKGLSDFVQNTLISIDRANASDNVIVIALPQNAVEEVQMVANGFETVRYLPLDEICSDNYAWIDHYQNYGSDDFGKFTISKWRSIKYLLNSGFKRVTYTDVDIAWIRNPLPLISDILNGFELAIQTEGLAQFPPVYCTGFMSYRNTDFTMVLLNQLEKYHVETVNAEPSAHDQILFNRVMRANPGILSKIYCLSEYLFPNGHGARSILSQDEHLERILAGRPSPMIFHANWTLGIENKRQLLQRTGNWFVS